MDNPEAASILRDMENASDLIIVGGGLTGPAMALAAVQAGLTSTVIDAVPAPVRADPAFDGRSYALALSSQRMLAALGLWDTLADLAQPILDIKVTDGVAGRGPGPFWMHFDHAELEEGPMGYMVEDRYVRGALRAACEAHPDIALIDGQSVTAQSATPGGISVTLDTGQPVSGRLLIGSDGRQSGTGARAGITRTEWGYGQTALVCAVAHERPHLGVAHQFFLPPGPLAILPLSGNRCSIVWSETSETAAKLHALDDDAYLAALRPRFGDFLGDLSLAGQRYTYPLGLTLANRLIDDRVVLIGDAAHGVHPIAGQGLNAGFRDVGALAEVLSDARRRGEDIAAADVLARYQSWRRFDTTTLALATDTFNRLFSNDNPILRTVRGLGMGVVNTVPKLRRSIIREAAGLTGDVPRLLQGRAL